MIIGGREFETNHTHIMGILNVTPDSFSDGGRHNDLEAALTHTEKMINEGAAIIDVGGESTRPGHVQITEEEEIDRVCSVISRIKAEFDVPVSIDTYKSRVAEAAISSGADLVNDIWGLKYDSNMGRVIANSKLPCCLMHNREVPAAKEEYFEAVINDMQEIIALSKEAGIEKDKIILDPGVGFGKTYEQNLEILAGKNFYMPKGYPVLLGTSRKSVIGLTLDLPVSERVEGTLVTTVLAVMNKCMFVRVHDVKENYRAVKMMERILLEER